MRSHTRAAAVLLASVCMADRVRADEEFSLGLREENVQAGQPRPQEGEPPEFEPEFEPGPAPRSEVELELALSDDAFWGTLQSRFGRGEGYVSGSVFANVDEDYVANLRVMRFGGPSADSPLRLGVGIGLYAAFDGDTDDDAYAVALTGAADWRLPTAFPARVGAELSFAPQVTSFEAADHLLDFTTRFELEISEFATAFFGYRLLEMGRDTGPDDELESGLHFGIRLSL